MKEEKVGTSLNKEIPPQVEEWKNDRLMRQESEGVNGTRLEVYLDTNESCNGKEE